MARRRSERDDSRWDKAEGRKFGLVNRETGEELDSLPILVPRKARIGQPFFMAMQEGLVALATDDRLTHDARRVLLYMLGKLDFENHIRVGQTEVGERLKIDKSRVSRAVKLLTETGILTSPVKVGRSTFYTLDPAYGWKGSARKLPKRKPEAPKPATAE